VRVMWNKSQAYDYANLISDQAPDSAHMIPYDSIDCLLARWYCDKAESHQLHSAGIGSIGLGDTIIWSSRPCRVSLVHPLHMRRSIRGRSGEVMKT
jgi:hypothetical protein